MSKEKDLEKLIEELQEKIENDEEVDFSKKVINEYRNPSNFGILENPDAVGKIKGPCGDTMEIMLKIKNNRKINQKEHVSIKRGYPSQVKGAALGRCRVGVRGFKSLLPHFVFNCNYEFL